MISGRANETMKKLLLSAMIIIVSQYVAHSQHTPCNREATFGEKKICLPAIDGYQECYTETVVKELADATEVSMNSVLGFYLKTETYDAMDSLGLVNIDDYFKVYATNDLQNYQADGSLLDDMRQMLSDNFITKNWDELSKEIDQVGLDAEIGVPVVIDSYRQNSESFSMVLLVKYAFEGIPPYTMAMTVNGYLSNDRLVWMAYYLKYEDQETIDRLKSKSHTIVSELLKAS